MRPYTISPTLTIDLDCVLAIDLTEPVLMQSHVWNVRALMVPENWRTARVPATPKWVTIHYFDTGVGISAPGPRSQAEAALRRLDRAWRRHHVLRVAA